jgi:hypothetical protein
MIGHHAVGEKLRVRAHRRAAEQVDIGLPNLIAFEQKRAADAAGHHVKHPAGVVKPCRTSHTSGRLSRARDRLSIWKDRPRSGFKRMPHFWPAYAADYEADVRPWSHAA